MREKKVYLDCYYCGVKIKEVSDLDWFFVGKTQRDEPFHLKSRCASLYLKSLKKKGKE